MPSRGDLRALFSRHQVIACLGTGGVGKTTTAAALALLSAESGRRTLCLTVDPARRLATSLGLEQFPREERVLSQEELRELGVAATAPLTVMMLDAESTFDDIVRKYSPTLSEAQRILEHKVYRQLSSHLSGTQAYMAMEKVLSVMSEGRFDTIVLDTPPSTRALDFLDAPERMVALLSSPATKALVRAFRGTKRLRVDVLAAGLRRMLLSLERITGSSLMADFAELLAFMDVLFESFEQRAQHMTRTLRSPKIGYVLVAAPRQRSVRDALDLVTELGVRGMGLSALVVNRMSPPGVSDAEPGDLISSPGFNVDADLSHGARSVAAALSREQAEISEAEKTLCAPLIQSLGADASVVSVPILASDVHQPRDLLKIARFLDGTDRSLDPL